jgi:hypothetical protein
MEKNLTLGISSSTLKSNESTTMSSILTIEDAKPAHGGIFVCQAESTLVDGSTWKHEQQKSTFIVESVAAKLKLHAKPTLLAKKKGQEATFDCNAEVYPLPVISWTMTKDDKRTKVVDSKKYKLSEEVKGSAAANQKLTIYNLIKDDRAIYKCKLETKKGTELATIQFQLKISDSMDIVWPILGIILEAIVLVIILVAEHCVKKKKAH